MQQYRAAATTSRTPGAGTTIVSARRPIITVGLKLPSDQQISGANLNSSTSVSTT